MKKEKEKEKWIKRVNNFEGEREKRINKKWTERERESRE